MRPVNSNSSKATAKNLEVNKFQIYKGIAALYKSGFFRTYKSENNTNSTRQEIFSNIQLDPSSLNKFPSKGIKTKGAELGLQQLPTPPIKTLSKEETRCALEKMIKDIKSYCGDAQIDDSINRIFLHFDRMLATACSTEEMHRTLNEMIKDIQSYRDDAQIDDTSNQRFLSFDRMLTTACMIGEIIHTLASQDVNCFGYFVNGNPVGISITSRDGIQVYDLLVHPGSEGVGGILIERAMQESQKKGNAILVMDPINEASESAYTALGFVNAGLEKVNKNLRNTMVLNPAMRPDIWVRGAQGQYQLKKHIKTGYIG